MYKSSHNPKAAPTGSSFGLTTTSKQVANLSGQVVAPSGSHNYKANSAMFGLPKGAAKPKTNTFRLKGTGNMVLQQGKFNITNCLFIFLDVSRCLVRILLQVEDVIEDGGSIIEVTIFKFNVTKFVFFV
jgi:hypothetical protein